MTGLPTTQQKRAKDAWGVVQDARKLSGSGELDDFSNQVKRLGPRIVTAGLGPALAFLAAKEKEKQDTLLLQRLSAWVLYKGEPVSTSVDLQQRIRDGNSDDLRRWTAEALEWIVWVKRFAEAEEKTSAAGNSPEAAQ